MSSESEPPCNTDPEAETPLATYTGALPGVGEVLVTVWWDGTAEIAGRLNPIHSWGQPVTLTKTDGSG